MAKMTISGLDDFSTMLYNIGDKGIEIATNAVYSGAGTLIEKVKEEINALPVEEGYLPNGRKRRAVTQKEKDNLISHIGISRIETIGGKTTVAIGFDGYTDYATKKYPSGVPVPLIARSIESGSSVREKIPFLRKAATNNKERVKSDMINAADMTINNINR